MFSLQEMESIREKSHSFVCIFYVTTIQRISVKFGILNLYLFYFILPSVCVYDYPWLYKAHKLRLSKFRMPRKVFAPERMKVTRENESKRMFEKAA
jgi:hypothetical protein